MQHTSEEYYQYVSFTDKFKGFFLVLPTDSTTNYLFLGLYRNPSLLSPPTPLSQIAPFLLLHNTVFLERPILLGEPIGDTKRIQPTDVVTQERGDSIEAFEVITRRVYPRFWQSRPPGVYARPMPWDDFRRNLDAELIHGLERKPQLKQLPRKGELNHETAAYLETILNVYYAYLMTDVCRIYTEPSQELGATWFYRDNTVRVNLGTADVSDTSLNILYTSTAVEPPQYYLTSLSDLVECFRAPPQELALVYKRVYQRWFPSFFAIRGGPTTQGYDDGVLAALGKVCLHEGGDDRLSFICELVCLYNSPCIDNSRLSEIGCERPRPETPVGPQVYIIQARDSYTACRAFLDHFQRAPYLWVNQANQYLFQKRVTIYDTVELSDNPDDHYICMRLPDGTYRVCHLHAITSSTDDSSDISDIVPDIVPDIVAILLQGRRQHILCRDTDPELPHFQAALTQLFRSRKMTLSSASRSSV